MKTVVNLTLVRSWVPKKPWGSCDQYLACARALSLFPSLSPSVSASTPLPSRACALYITHTLSHTHFHTHSCLERSWGIPRSSISRNANNKVRCTAHHSYNKLITKIQNVLSLRPSHTYMHTCINMYRQEECAERTVTHKKKA